MFFSHYPIFERIEISRGNKMKQCMDELDQIFGDEAPSENSIYR